MLGTNTNHEQDSRVAPSSAVSLSELKHERYLPCVSPAMRALAASLARVAASEVPILIGGEVGTGKSTLARQVHEDSPRRHTPLIVLYGPTATVDAIGDLAPSSVATVLIEEVGELTPTVQDALVRVLSMQPPRGGLRLIATSSCDLGELARRRGMRGDLLYRLDVVRLEIPPLRRRPEDILFLAEHFLVLASRAFRRDVRALSADAGGRLQHHHWPGNVRELGSCILESVLYCPHTRLRAVDLRLRTALGGTDPEAELTAAFGRLHATQPGEFYARSQRLLLQWALQSCGGNRVRTAALLGLGRGALRAKLRRYGFEST